MKSASRPDRFAPWENLCYTLNRMLFGIHSDSGCWGGGVGTERERALLPTIELGFLHSSGHRLFTTPTVLARLTRRRLQFIHPSIYSIVCLMTGLYPLPKRVPHRGKTIASSFYFRYPLVSLRLSNSYLSLPPRVSATLSYFIVYVGYYSPP